MAKYGKKAQAKVRKVMHERKEGKLESGGSHKKVKSRKQAIAIGLSEARRAGAKVPPNPNRASKTAAKKSSKKSAAKKSSKKSAARKSSKKSAARKSSKKSAARKSSKKKSSAKKASRKSS